MNSGVVILGSTGSVGASTLDVIRLHPERFQVSALAANNNAALMLDQCIEFRPQRVVMVDSGAAIRLRTDLASNGLDIEVLTGAQNLEQLVSDSADSVVCAIVGAVGLASTLAAVRTGSRVLIANKEPLVMLGHYIMDLARQNGSLILPLDSEHNAIFQCLPASCQQRLGMEGWRQQMGVRRLLLTGSGGPFRTLDPAEFENITPKQACAHPNWQMGPKISVDSATMMNKGLELIEACALFAMDERDIDIVVHPQSVVHSMVEYIDGSVLSQMANPDMKVPIANALGWPDRIESGARSVDFFECARFDFMPPDHERFPALALAREVARTGGTAPAVLNAANEVAVDAFLGRTIPFNRITDVVKQTLEKVPSTDIVDLESALASDRMARRVCRQILQQGQKIA